MRSCVHFLHLLLFLEDVEGAGETALHNCARVGDLEIAKELIARGAAINRSQQGETPLMTAAYKGHEDFVSFFVDTPDCSRDEKADALELLGSYFLEKGDTDRCLALWQRAMEERHRPGRPVAGKREAGEQVSFQLAHLSSFSFQGKTYLYRLSVCLHVLLQGKTYLYRLSVCLHVSLSVYLFFCLHTCFSVRIRLPTCLFVSVCLSVCFSVCLPVSLSVVFFCLVAFLSVSVCLSVLN